MRPMESAYDMNINEILNLGTMCIQGESANCIAACPVRVNIPLIVQNVKEGKFRQAYEMYESKVIFPGVLSRICDEPCKANCIRKEMDHSISVRLLEKSVVDYGKEKTSKGVLIGPKKKRVCIIGSSLSGMCCAIASAKNGYQVTIYEKSNKLGGRLNDYVQNVLPQSVLDTEMGRMTHNGVEVHLNRNITDLKDVAFDACFIATDKGTDISIFASQKTSCENTSEQVFEGMRPEFFLLPEKNGDTSPVVEVNLGIQASIAIDQYFRGTPPVSSREGKNDSVWYKPSKINKTEKQESIVPTAEQGYSKEEALQEAARCLQCVCNECKNKCLYLQSYSGNPKTIIKELASMYYAPRGLSKRKHMHQLNSCSMCGLCQELCPTQLGIGGMSAELKKLFVAEGSMPESFHDFWLNDLEYSLGDEFFMCENQLGTIHNKYLFFPGCQMGASNPEYVINAYKYLITAIVDGVGLCMACCGVPAIWAGDKKRFDENKEKIQLEWEKHGRPVLIVACPTCQKIFRQYYGEIQVVSLWEIFDKLGLPESSISGTNIEVAVYDPCASRYVPHIQKSVRKLITKMGYSLNELEMSEKYAQCCSYGGLISSVNPKLAKKIRDDRTNASPYDYVTYCTNCRDDFAGNGKRTWHLLDMIFATNNTTDHLKTAPSRSQRMLNKRETKRAMMKIFWGREAHIEQFDYDTISTIIPDELIRKMDSRFILMKDLKQVIHHAETTGIKMIDKNTGHTFAHLKTGNVTFWVEYKRNGTDYIICNAYSHRVQAIEEGENDEGRT